MTRQYSCINKLSWLSRSNFERHIRRSFVTEENSPSSRGSICFIYCSVLANVFIILLFRIYT